MVLKQIVFIIVLLITIGIFAYSISKIIKNFRLTKKAFPIKDIGKRIILMLKVAFFQNKIFRKPISGIIHALVFWGFCIIVLGSSEMIIDGIFGLEHSLAILGPAYSAISGLGDIFAYIIGISVLIFLFRRLFLNIGRLHGPELKKKNHQDANFALFLIFLLMLSLAGMNIFYVAALGDNLKGFYPISAQISNLFSLSPDSTHLFHEINWWGHILLILFFMNILPYSKHFHIFMSIPNVFLSRLDPLGKVPNMENVTKEVKLMMDPETAFAAPSPDEVPQEIERFGIKDIEDSSWKNYLDSLTCTQCGRCTSVCPANITGKQLSPRKLFIDLRQRMKEKSKGLIKEGKDYNDNKSFIRDYISEEEIWACTTCNACAQECPLNINHPTLIIDMRRYLVMEEAAAPAELNAIFTNIENNGAPWQFSPEDRLLWTE